MAAQISPGKTPTALSSPKKTPTALSSPKKTPTALSSPKKTPSALSSPKKTPTALSSPKKTPSALSSPKKTPTALSSPKKTPSALSSPKKTPTVLSSPKKTPTVRSSPKKTPTALSSPKKTPTALSSPKKTPTARSSPKKTPSALSSPKKTPTAQSSPKKTPTTLRSPKTTPAAQISPRKTPTALSSPDKRSTALSARIRAPLLHPMCDPWPEIFPGSSPSAAEGSPSDRRPDHPRSYSQPSALPAAPHPMCSNSILPPGPGGRARAATTTSTSTSSGVRCVGAGLPYTRFPSDPTPVVPIEDYYTFPASRGASRHSGQAPILNHTCVVPIRSLQGIGSSTTNGAGSSSEAAPRRDAHFELSDSGSWGLGYRDVDGRLVRPRVDWGRGHADTSDAVDSGDEGEERREGTAAGTLCLALALGLHLTGFALLTAGIVRFRRDRRSFPADPRGTTTSPVPGQDVAASTTLTPSDSLPSDEGDVLANLAFFGVISALRVVLMLALMLVLVVRLRHCWIGRQPHTVTSWRSVSWSIVEAMGYFGFLVELLFLGLTWVALFLRRDATLWCGSAASALGSAVCLLACRCFREVSADPVTAQPVTTHPQPPRVHRPQPPQVHRPQPPNVPPSKPPQVPQQQPQDDWRIEAERLFAEESRPLLPGNRCCGIPSYSGSSWTESEISNSPTVADSEPWSEELKKMMEIARVHSLTYVQPALCDMCFSPETSHPPSGQCPPRPGPQAAANQR